MARNVCKDDLPAAQYTYYEFEIEINKQNVDKILDGETGRQLILVKARAFVHLSDETGFLIPPEALEEDGGVGVVTPGVADTIWTNNGEAAFLAETGTFAGTNPVTVVLTRLADPVPDAPDYPIPGYQAFPEAYDFSASAPLSGFAEFWMCVVEPLPEGVDFFDLIIGHDLGNGESEELHPPLYQDFNGQVIDCADAALQPVVVASAGSPAWLRLAGLVLEPVVSRILDVKPLNAMYFAGTGLGGRGNSISPFAPVRASYRTLDFAITGQGQLFIDGTGVCAQAQTSAYCTTQEYAPGTEVWIDAEAFGGFAFDSWPGGVCETTDGPLCKVVMDADKTVSVLFGSIGYTLNLTVGPNGTVDYGGSAACGPDTKCTEIYPTADGLQLYLRANPDDGYRTVWSQDCAGALRDVCYVDWATRMDVTAQFQPITSTMAISLTSITTGGAPADNAGPGTISDSEGNSCTFAEAGAGTCTWSYSGAPTVTISVQPDLSYGGNPVWTTITGAASGSCDAPESDVYPVTCSYSPSGSVSATVNVWRTN